MARRTTSADEHPGASDEPSASGANERCNTARDWVAQWTTTVARSTEPVWVLTAAMAVWVLVFGNLVLLRHDRFGSFSLDMGIFDQMAWLLSRGHTFMTIRGLEFLGHHANFGVLLFVPFYWLGAGPNFMNVVMVVSMALGAIPIYLLTRRATTNEWIAVVLAVAYLLHPSLQFMAWELFHPETMAITGLLFAWWFASKRQWLPYALTLAYAVSWKEDVALAALVIGVVVLIRGDRKVGLITAAASAAWFVFVNKWMLPTFSGAGAAFYNNLFGDLGATPTKVAATIARHPSELTSRIFAPDAKTFAWQLLAPFAFLPFLGPFGLAVGAPQYLVDILTAAGFTRQIYYHYAALPLVGVVLGSIETIGWVARRRLPVAVFLAGVVLASSVVGSVSWGPSPIGHEYRKGWWPLTPNTREVAEHAAVHSIPSDAHVSATYLLAPHLTHRRYAYDWPNPWISNNWAVNGENLDDPNVVHWLVLDRQNLDARGQQLLQQLVDDGQFRIVSDQSDIVVAHRVRAGARPPVARTG